MFCLDKTFVNDRLTMGIKYEVSINCVFNFVFQLRLVFSYKCVFRFDITLIGDCVKTQRSVHQSN